MIEVVYESDAEQSPHMALLEQFIKIWVGKRSSIHQNILFLRSTRLRPVKILILVPTYNEANVTKHS